MRYLLDTNIVSDLIRNPQGGVTRRITDVGEALVCTSVVVAAELRFGAAKLGSARLTKQMALVLDRLDVLPLDAPADELYGDLRARLEAAGTPIGANDMLIAAHAMSLECTIVTDNMREFSRIDGLACENWLRPD
ncbi:type II toxin-antitoxin system VapC family toxin [Sphingomonas sp. BT-65]|uniref:type II toxin-antitoxin system VapC family toxin n=1 Tax=Sphingomonas sp. BT-65 TaxID=2989821 RepID=UPI002235B847|nr:type II toxin-antitoxin system VapC family toxin [Sphingomonas sp. BT-65]MCW4462959.1 type II toxin-antitoxin system VapC family toxin [Sphingomonas sp. BT-65]